MEIDNLFAEAILASEDALPRVGQSPASFAGRTFHYGVEAPDRRGVYLLVFEYENRIYPLYVGEGRSIRLAIARKLSKRDALSRLTHGFYWAPTASEADGQYLARHLIAALQPHFNSMEAAPVDKPIARPLSRPTGHDVCLRSQPADEAGHAACRRHGRLAGTRRAGYAPARPATRSSRRTGADR